jgi:hypothetical protein
VSNLTRVQALRSRKSVAPRVLPTMFTRLRKLANRRGLLARRRGSSYKISGAIVLSLLLAARSEASAETTR